MTEQEQARKNEILLRLAKGEIKTDEASKLLEQFEGKGGSNGELSVKANPESRTMSLYGLQRMPVTLHRSQWERLFKEGPKVIGEFIDKHGEYLPTEKGQTVKPVPKSLIGEKGCPFRVPKEKAA